MIRNTKRRCVLILLIFIILFIILINSRFVMYTLPKGDFINELNSPNSEYSLRAYRYSGGATVDWSLRIEVVNNLTHKKYNIYWKYHEKDADMVWLDDENVRINGIQLNIHKDYYHK